MSEHDSDTSPFTSPAMEEIGPVYRDWRCRIGWHKWGAPLCGIRACIRRGHCPARKAVRETPDA